MAEEVLVKEILSAEQIAAGEELLKRLDRAKANVIAAYWVYVPAVAEWHLELVSPRVESDGPCWKTRMTPPLWSCHIGASMRLNRFQLPSNAILRSAYDL